jgi:ribosomal protein S12 methylthiotransferase
LQHISDPVLKRMGRRVTRAETEELIGKLRDRIEGLMIRTTFIAGFPGETDEQFRELLEFVEDTQFDAVGVFAYSPEPGTPAEKLDGAVPAGTRQARAEELMLAQQQIAFAKADAMLEDELAILVDGPDEQGRCIGRHYGQAPEIDSVCILTEPVEAGSVLFARVVGSEGYDLVVEPAEESDETPAS